MKILRLVTISSVITLSSIVSLRIAKAQIVPTALPCQPFNIGTDTRSGLPEVQGRSDTQTLWALLFPYHLPVWSDEDLKIVWRMTGTGNFSLKAQHTDGTMIQPNFGPEPHGGST